MSDPDGRTAQGLLARRFFLDGGISTTAANDPQLSALYKDKFTVEDQIDQLRGKKSSMTADAYDDALEVLLVHLARKSKSIRELEGRKSGMMRLALRGFVSLTFALALLIPRSMAAQDDGHDLFRAGKYQQAIAALNKVPASDSDWAASQRDLVRAYAAVGKYDEAEAAGRRAVLSPKGGIVWNPLGEVLITRGKRAAAESAFVRARPTPDSLIASLNLAVLHYDRGDRDQAMKEFDRFIDVYNRSLGND